MTQSEYEHLSAAEHERFEGGYAAFLLNGEDSLRAAYIAGYAAARPEPPEPDGDLVEAAMKFFPTFHRPHKVDYGQQIIDLGYLRHVAAAMASFAQQHAARADAPSDDELTQLRREYELSSLGDRPPSMAAAKLRRLMELESDAPADVCEEADLCQLCGGTYGQCDGANQYPHQFTPAPTSPERRSDDAEAYGEGYGYGHKDGIVAERERIAAELRAVLDATPTNHSIGAIEQYIDKLEGKQ